MKKHRDYQLVTAETRRNDLVSQPNYRITKYFAENLLTVELRKNSSIKKQACLFRFTNIRSK